MDLDREMDALAREARKKLEDERLEAASADKAREALAAAAASSAGKTSLGAKLAGAVLAMVAIWLAWTYVVAPLVKWGLLIAILVAIAWVVWKVAGGGARDEPESPAT